MKKNINKRNSIIIVALIYILASIIGLFVYDALTLHFAWKLLIADTVATIVVYVFSLIFSNASVYDPYWSVQPIVIVALYALENTLSPLAIVTIIVICLWGLRLTLNWAYTFGGLKHEDWRYVNIAKKTGKIYPVVNFLGIHYVPTLIVYACTLPAVYSILFYAEAGVWSYVMLAVSAFAFVMQGIADVQMHRYRKNRTTSFIRVGLWKHSRHPNYLGEILMWWGVGLSATLAIGEWYLITGAVLNTLLFLFISIPLADGRQSKKEGFSEYKRKTRMLLPIPKWK